MMENLAVNVNSLSISKHISSKVELIESTLHQAIYSFRDFVNEFEQMNMTTESFKKQIIAQKERCESKCCTGSEELKKVIESKENIIQSVALALSKLSNTKDFNILNGIFKILFGESTLVEERLKEEGLKENVKSHENTVPVILLSQKKEALDMSIEEEVSVCEIDGTPTGRCSPIIQSKKLKTSLNNTPTTENKKCPQNWETPEKKNMKVTLKFPSPARSKGSGRLRQQRITFQREKLSTSVDLTTLPQFSKGRNSQSEECFNNIKQEVFDNEDTIMPSPTSGPVIPPAFKSFSKESPQKFKKPLSLIRSRVDKTLATNDCKENSPLPSDVTYVPELEQSVNLLKEFTNGLSSPNKCKTRNKSPSKANDSISLLQQFQVNECAVQSSPIKRPLAENMSVLNIPCDNESSMSILRKALQIKMEPLEDNIRRTKSEITEPLYKEPTVRKRAEKMALPGWSCDECRKFYGELYENDPEMQAKKMEVCSKHRGRNNPIRPKTPPGYWEPRWDVPEDTEEFNRRNNV